MSLSLTPERIAAVYECLRQFPPFAGWRLPPPSEVTFGVCHKRDRHAEYDTPPHRLRASAATIGHFDTLAVGVAHEMVHMKLRAMGEKNWDAHNSEGFKRLSALVCRRFGWDAKAF